MQRAILLAGVVLVACGGGGGNGDLGDSACELAATVSGEVTWTASAAPACLIPFGGDEGILMVYVPLDEAVARFEIDVADVTEGEIGQFAATIDVTAGDDRVWRSADCVLDIERHVFESEDDFSKSYLASGTGECATPATALRGDATGELTIDPFAFHFPPHW